MNRTDWILLLTIIIVGILLILWLASCSSMQGAVLLECGDADPHYEVKAYCDERTGESTVEQLMERQ